MGFEVQANETTTVALKFMLRNRLNEIRVIRISFWRCRIHLHTQRDIDVEMFI